MYMKLIGVHGMEWNNIIIASKLRLQNSYVDLHQILLSVKVEDACLVALTTAYNARDTEGGTTKQELFHFVEEVSRLGV